MITNKKEVGQEFDSCSTSFCTGKKVYKKFKETSVSGSVERRVLRLPNTRPSMAVAGGDFAFARGLAKPSFLTG
jgi:hypothetical protein